MSTTTIYIVTTSNTLKYCQNVVFIFHCFLVITLREFNMNIIEKCVNLYNGAVLDSERGKHVLSYQTIQCTIYTYIYVSSVSAEVHGYLQSMILYKQLYKISFLSYLIPATINL